jgi:hypothetical protein
LGPRWQPLTEFTFAFEEEHQPVRCGRPGITDMTLLNYGHEPKS